MSGGRNNEDDNDVTDGLPRSNLDEAFELLGGTDNRPLGIFVHISMIRDFITALERAELAVKYTAQYCTEEANRAARHEAELLYFNNFWRRRWSRFKRYKAGLRCITPPTIPWFICGTISREPNMETVTLHPELMYSRDNGKSSTGIARKWKKSVGVCVPSMRIGGKDYNSEPVEYFDPHDFKLLGSIKLGEVSAAANVFMGRPLSFLKGYGYSIHLSNDYEAVLQHVKLEEDLEITVAANPDKYIDIINAFMAERRDELKDQKELPLSDLGVTQRGLDNNDEENLKESSPTSGFSSPVSYRRVPAAMKHKIGNLFSGLRRTHAIAMVRKLYGTATAVNTKFEDERDKCCSRRSKDTSKKTKLLRVDMYAGKKAVTEYIPNIIIVVVKAPQVSFTDATHTSTITRVDGLALIAHNVNDNELIKMTDNVLCIVIRSKGVAPRATTIPTIRITPIHSYPLVERSNLISTSGTIKKFDLNNERMGMISSPRLPRKIINAPDAMKKYSADKIPELIPASESLKYPTAEWVAATTATVPIPAGEDRYQPRCKIFGGTPAARLTTKSTITTSKQIDNQPMSKFDEKSSTSKFMRKSDTLNVEETCFPSTSKIIEKTPTPMMKTEQFHAEETYHYHRPALAKIVDLITSPKLMNKSFDMMTSTASKPTTTSTNSPIVAGNSKNNSEQRNDSPVATKPAVKNTKDASVQVSLEPVRTDERFIFKLGPLYYEHPRSISPLKMKDVSIHTTGNSDAVTQPVEKTENNPPLQASLIRHTDRSPDRSRSDRDTLEVLRYYSPYIRERARSAERYTTGRRYYV